MLRRLSGLLLVALNTTPLLAQARQETLIGPIGGVNFAKFGGDDVSRVDTRTGFHAGLFASFPLGRYVALVPGAAFSQEGTSVDLGGGATGTLKIDYLEVPVLLKLGAPLQGKGNLRPYVIAGPGVGFKVSCKVRAENASQSAEADCDDPTVGAATKSVQFSAIFGGGLDIGRFTFGLRYQLGLTSIDNSAAEADVKNRVLALFAGYGFRLGH